MTEDPQGSIYQVMLTSRTDTWNAAYARELQDSFSAYQSKHGGEPTHIQLPSCIDPAALNLNGLKVMRHPIGRGSLALWGAAPVEEVEPVPDNGNDAGVYICRRCEAESIDPAAVACWACGFDGRKE
jgi:hypothetical protein